MQESYGEGVANHTGPESCVAGRKDGDETLTGVRAGRPLNREIESAAARRSLPGADAYDLMRKATPGASLSRDAQGPGAVEDPRMHGNISHGNRESRSSSAYEGSADRVGKSKDSRR